MKEKMNLYSKTIGLQIEYFQNGKVENISSFDENGGIISQYSYYENEQLKDSIFYNEKGKVDSAFHYFKNGNVKAKYFFDERKKMESLIAYDENGEKLKNIIYSSEAHFRKGDEDWSYFLQQNLNPNIAVDNNAPDGEYTIIVRFNVEKDGSISNIKAETNNGYGMKEHAIHTIKDSPKWVPATFLGQPIISYRRQPVTIVKSEH